MSYWDDKEVVVTGGAGFLGSFLSEHLLDRGVPKNHIRTRLGRIQRGLFGLIYDAPFTYRDFYDYIYPHFSEREELQTLSVRTKHATPYETFWSSHTYEGCLHDANRQYLALGVCCSRLMT
jgi:hypothetical protein